MQRAAQKCCSCILQALKHETVFNLISRTRHNTGWIIHLIDDYVNFAAAETGCLPEI